MTWVTVFPTNINSDWTPQGHRVRSGPDGTLAVWHRESLVANPPTSPYAHKYTLTHFLPDGRMVGPVTSYKANDARKAMKDARTALGIKTPQ